MPDWKGEMFFRQGARGWSESWYTSSFATSDGALTSLNRVADVRLTALGAQGVIQGVRVSNIAVRGDSAVLFRDDVQQPGYLVQDDGSDIASTCWYLQAIASDTTKKQVMLRGMPDSWFDVQNNQTDPDTIPPHPGVLQFVSRYKTVLKAEGWGMYGLIIGPGRQGTNIWDITRDGLTGVMEIHLDPAGLIPAVGQSFRMYGRGLTPKIDSLQYAEDVNGAIVDTYQILPLDFVYSGGMVIRTLQKGVQEMVDLQPVRVTRKKTGRAFFVPAGRARRRKKRR